MASSDKDEHFRDLRLGTSAFTATGWPGSFYPKGLTSADYLKYYSQHFNAVEIDSTFYGTPRHETVRRWREQTPQNFIFAVKAPKAITHEKGLQDCAEDFSSFLKAMDPLGDKLGPILFQFPYFKQQDLQFPDFLARLKAFLKDLPQEDGHLFAVEVRNKGWINERLLGLLRERGVALALIAHPWMWPPAELFERVDPSVDPFVYIRLLGDRYAIEKVTKRWDRLVVDRKDELADWAAQCHQIRRGGKTIYFFANNHYAGHGPATLRIFRQLYLAGLGIENSENRLDLFHGMS